MKASVLCTYGDWSAKLYIKNRSIQKKPHPKMWPFLYFLFYSRLACFPYILVESNPFFSMKRRMMAS